MNPLPASADFLHLAHRPDADLLIGRWLRSVSEPELRAGYAALREAALAHRCRRWLVDARRRVDRSRNAPEWVVTGFLPQVQHELDAALRVAFLVLPQHLRELHTGAAAPLASPAGAPFQFARFIDEGAANAWLAAP